MAAAIAGIVGAVTAVTQLLPDEPAKRAATFDNVRVVPRVPLSEYNIRAGAADEGPSASAGGRTVALRLVAQETGAAEPQPAPAPSRVQPGEGEPAEQGEAGPDPADPEPGDGDAPERSPYHRDAEPGSGEGDAEREPGGEGDASGPSRPDVPPIVKVTAAQARTEVDDVLPPEAATIAPDGTMDFRDEEVETAVRQVVEPEPDFGDTGSRDRPIAAAEVVAVFKATRSVLTPEGREPLGVLVDFEVGAVGFEGERLDVRWTLYGARTRRRVPREWLANRRALLLEPDVEDERGSATMWVPLPKARGPWFVRLSLFDSRGRRLTFVDTRRFG